MKQTFILLEIVIAFSLNGQTLTANIANISHEKQDTVLILRQPNKLINVNHPVYELLGLYEALGITGFLPLARPYSKAVVINYLEQLLLFETLTEKEKKVIRLYLKDIYSPANGLKLKEHTGASTYAVVGASAEIAGRNAWGNNATYSTSNIFEPAIAGDIGKHISFYAGIGVAIDRLAPDLFYRGFVKSKEVHFPYEHIGYAFHPYQFNYETMWRHVNASGKQGAGPPLQKDLTAGMIYHTELNGSWADGNIRLHIHNQRRSWGYSADNLVLSNNARRFLGIDLKIEPTPWLRYSFLVGSLFAYSSQYNNNIYNYDLGHVQKMLTLHMVEFSPFKQLQVTLTGGNIWSKRLELAYLVPFVLPHLTQSDIGNYDNTVINMDIALLLPKLGKTWFSLFVDEFNFTKGEKKLKMPRNRYAWQVGWKTGLLNSLLPATFTEISYTRLTPFVYTHYPESDFNPLGTERPLDMTYTHDNSNLGFYLPPNSSEFKLHLTNMAIPDLTIKMDNRFIIHGTNDLAGDTHQIFGDIYRHQYGDIYQYPLMDFTQDGIYDYTWCTELKVEKKIRWSSYLNYFRVVASLGYSHTSWQSNESGVVAPENHSLFSSELGIIVDF
jgi:hypothetical protein